MQLTCPTQSQLRDFLDGAIDDAEGTEIEAHINGCPNCDQVLCKLESEQSDVLRLLRDGARTESLLKEPEFQTLRDTARFGREDTTPAFEDDDSLETGNRLGDYRLVRKIGEGGMGTVYQAVHVHLAKSVALKILPADKLVSRQSVGRFRQEMRAVGRVNHPNVVSASDAGKIDDQHFLVMELVEGADLARIIHDQGPLRVSDACEIVRQAATGLQHSHDNGLVHRDVKPSNVMLAIDGRVKLLDLGLASLNKTDFESTANVVVTDRLTSVGQIMGTLDYMAPEQITASPDVDCRADVYALGATLFQLLTGRTPCGDRSQATPERVNAVLSEPPLEITTLRSDVSEELRSLLLKMLAKNPKDRPQTATEVASEIARFASDSNLVALAEACRKSLDMPSADVNVTDDASLLFSRTVEPQNQVTKPKARTAIGLFGALLATLLVAGVYFIVTNHGIVKVEVVGEAFQVAIDDQTVTLSEDGNSQPITLRAGDHEVVVSVGDTNLMTKEFEINRNDEVVLRVELLQGVVIVSNDGKTIGKEWNPETNLPSVVHWTPSQPAQIVATTQERFKGEELIESAKQLVKDGDLKAATDTYLKALRIHPDLLSFEDVEVFQKANRIVELGDCINETGLKRRIFNEYLCRYTIKDLLSDPETRDLGYRLLKNYFRIYVSRRRGVLVSPEDYGIAWKDVPDLSYFLRVLLIPTDFEKEGAGWERYSVHSTRDTGTESGPLTDAKALFFDQEVLRELASEVRELTAKHTAWKGGLVLLAALEAELGDFNEAKEIITEHFIGPKGPIIPVSTAWVLGLALEGKDHDLDQLVIQLYEYSLRDIVLNFSDPSRSEPPASTTLRASPLNELARLYAKYDRRAEARQLLYGLVDVSDQHSLVQGYTPSVFDRCLNPGRCNACHRTEMNVDDYVLMSRVLTEIGYPVDAFVSLARIDASFSNAYTSSDGWVEQESDEGRRLYELVKWPKKAIAKYGLPLRKRQAQHAVTPRLVIDALELGTFESSPRFSQKTYDRIRDLSFSKSELRLYASTLEREEKPDYEIDLMLSVRGEGPDAKATVFSPVIDLLKLAADYEGENAAEDIADLDARLRLLSEVNSKDVQTAVASTMFAFLRNDLETAKRRLENLQELRLSPANYAQRANTSLWLVARQALRHESTRIVGAVLAEKAIAAAESIPESRIKEAILLERLEDRDGRMSEQIAPLKLIP